MSPHDIELKLPAKAENLAVVRQAVAGLAVSRGAPSELVDDVKTAVTEASMNAVVHAYRDREELGVLEVTAGIETTRLTICVRDYGTGIKPMPVGNGSPGLRVGLPLIGALADEVEISGAIDRGTSIQMVFDLDREKAEPAPAKEPRLGHSETKLVASTDGGSGAIGPVISMLAARLDFSIDRLSDLHLIGDLLASAVPSSAEESPLRLTVEEAESTLLIEVGPMASGMADGLVRRAELAGMGNALERIVNRVEVMDSGTDSERLVLEVAKRR